MSKAQNNNGTKHLFAKNSSTSAGQKYVTEKVYIVFLGLVLKVFRYFSFREIAESLKPILGDAFMNLDSLSNPQYFFNTLLVLLGYQLFDILYNCTSYFYVLCYLVASWEPGMGEGLQRGRNYVFEYEESKFVFKLNL